MSGQKVSVDEYLSKRGAHVGKTESGREAVFKGFAAPPSFDAEARKAEFTVSSQRIDRDGDIVVQKGIDLAAFEQNPQALLFHNSRGWPVGQWSDMRKKLRTDPPRTEGTLNFAPADGPIPEVDQSFWAVQNGLIRTVSIGFMPLDLEMIEHKDEDSPWPYGFLISSSELYEISLVPVPAQSDAVAKDLLARGEAQPAREFIEEVMDQWARDPRTKMFVPKKELEETYTRYFGKNAAMIMALDSILPQEKSTLIRAEREVAKAAEEHGFKQIVMDPGDPTADVADAVDAVSGIQIHINISQGDTGANTRTGTDVGDQGTAAADASVQTVPPSQREAEPEIKEPHPLLARAKEAIGRFFGGGEAPTTQPKLVPGAYEQRKGQISTALERLRTL
jgi:phage head maturation protease